MISGTVLVLAEGSSVTYYYQKSSHTHFPEIIAFYFFSFHRMRVYRSGSIRTRIYYTSNQVLRTTPGSWEFCYTPCDTPESIPFTYFKIRNISLSAFGINSIRIN